MYDKITLVAEVREPKLRGGNMYLTLKDDNGYINCIIWKSNITKEISLLKEGSKIKVIGNQLLSKQMFFKFCNIKTFIY